MTIKAIRLKNFMAFEDTGWVELLPITLLFGRNSSGKSVITRAMRFLKQSLTQSPEGSPFAYSAEHGVDVGSFYEMGHGEDANLYKTGERKITFGFRCKVSPEVLIYLLQPETVGETTGEIKETYADMMLSFGQWQGQIILTRVEILDEEGLLIFYADFLGDDGWYWGLDLLPGYREDVPEIASEITSYWSEVKINLTKGFLPILPSRFVKSDEIQTVSEDYDNISTLFKNCVDSITSYFNSIVHLGPVRPSPKRYYVLDDSQQRHWELQGLDAFIRFLKGHLSNNEQEQLNVWLNKLGLAESIKAISPPLWEEEFSGVVAKVELDEGISSHHSVNLLDVGFGASQVLPIIIQSILAKPESLVIIEQPELHLHPEAQAILADFFIEYAMKGKTFLLETHSEHLLLRLQRRIVETTYHYTQSKQREEKSFRPESLNIIFVKRDRGISCIENIELNEMGQETEPSLTFQDFFKRDYEDVYHLEKTIAEIMLLKRKATDKDHLKGDAD